MIWLCLALIPIAAMVSWPVAALVIRASHRLGAIDTEPLPGQIKMARRKIPNTGGIAIFAGFIAPLTLILLLLPGANATASDSSLIPTDAIEQLPDLAARIPSALWLIACTTALHLLGLIDDRRPLGPFIKLALMAAISIAFILGTNSRLLTLLDPIAGGPWLSIALTTLWILVVTNAMNFMDNMDGLSGGVAAICAGCFAATAAMHHHWFVASCFTLLAGSLLGFLRFNFPPAKLFMGDGGSLVIGFLLAALAVRISYIQPSTTTVPWHALLTPLAILAVPLYDFVSVTIVRLSQRKSPFVGDLNHFSHRLVRRGLTKRAAVVVIYGFTATTGLSGVLLSHLNSWQATLAATQVLVMLLVVAVFEYSAATAPDSEAGKL
jgi:UDP-GlcNAc:undecaprenyl-phosphate GlcNAc-1-phosphate transferase